MKPGLLPITEQEALYLIRLHENADMRYNELYKAIRATVSRLQDHEIKEVIEEVFVKENRI